MYISIVCVIAVACSVFLLITHTHTHTRPHTHTHTVRPVPRKGNEVSASSSRDALLAGAGVTVIGQRRKPRQLDT